MLGEPWGEPAAEAAGLSVWLRTPLPSSLDAGAGSALFLHGAAVHAQRQVRRIELVAGGERRPAMATAMPSPTLAAELGDPRAARAIFWGVIPLAPGPVELGLVATLDDGSRLSVALGAPAPGEVPPQAPAAGA